MKGLKKSMELDNGVIGNHWGVTSVQIHIPSNKCEIRLELYLDKKAYDSGKGNIGMSKQIISDLPPEMITQIEMILAKAKEEKQPGQVLNDPIFFKDSMIE